MQKYWRHDQCMALVFALALKAVNELTLKKGGELKQLIDILVSFNMGDWVLRNVTGDKIHLMYLKYVRFIWAPLVKSFRRPKNITSIWGTDDFVIRDIDT